jgi:hypothetical protein
MAGRLTAVLAVLALAGCDLGDSPERDVATPSGATTTAPAPTLTQPRPSRTELVVQAIRSCEVKRIFFAHGANTWITFPGGNTVRTRRLATGKIERAAWKHADGCNILIGIE